MLNEELYGKVFIEETEEGKAFKELILDTIQELKSDFRILKFEARLAPDDFADNYCDLRDSKEDEIREAFKNITNVKVRYDRYFRFNYNGDEIYVNDIDVCACYKELVADNITYLLADYDFQLALNVMYCTLYLDEYYFSSKEKLNEAIEFLFRKFLDEGNDVNLTEFIKMHSEVEEIINWNLRKFED